MDVAIGEGIPVLGARVDDGPVLDRAFGDCLVERSADGRRRFCNRIAAVKPPSFCSVASHILNVGFLNPSTPTRLNGDHHVTHDQIRKGRRA